MHSVEITGIDSYAFLPKKFVKVTLFFTYSVEIVKVISRKKRYFAKHLSKIFFAYIYAEKFSVKSHPVVPKSDPL